MPKIYAITSAGLLLRAAERFGRDPFTWIDALTPGQRSLVIAHEIVRSAEEARAHV